MQGTTRRNSPSRTFLHFHPIQCWTKRKDLYCDILSQVRLSKPVTGCPSKDPFALFSIGSDGSARRFSKDYFYRWCPAFWSWDNVNWVKNIQPSVAKSCSPYVAVEAPISIIGVGKDSTILLIIKYNITITLQWLDGISLVSLARTR